MAETGTSPAVGSAPHPWWKRMLATLGLLAFSVIFSLLLGELAIRIVAPQQLPNVRPDIWQPDDSLGWRNRGDVNSTVNTGERTAHIMTDSLGFRIGSGPRPTGDTRILLIGDSFMQALQVEYEQCLSGLLEARLPKAIGRPVVVEDAGTDGWDSPQYLIRARQLLDRRPYSMVLVSVYVGNDAVTRRWERIPARVHAEASAFRFPRRLAWGEFVDAILHPFNDFIKRRSMLFVFLKSRFQTVLMRTGLTGADYPEEYMRRQHDSPRWSVTADIFKDLAAAGATHHTPVVFFLVPSAFQVDTAEFRAFQKGFNLSPDSMDLDQPTERLKSEMEARGLTVYDALPALRGNHASTGVALNGKVDRHLSPAGHDVLEQFLEPRVAAVLSAPAKP